MPRAIAPKRAQAVGKWRRPRLATDQEAMPGMSSLTQAPPCAKGSYFLTAAVIFQAIYRTGASVYVWAGESRGQVFVPIAWPSVCLLTVPSLQTD